jgi:LacI family transcriptional regulator
MLNPMRLMRIADADQIGRDMPHDPPPPAPSPTLRTIARELGISVTAVSLALRNEQGVSAETRTRVHLTAARLGYRPNPLVTAFQSYVRTGRGVRYEANLAWINDHPTADFWRTEPWTEGYLTGAQARAAELGFKLEEFHLAAHGPDPARALERLAHVLESRGIHGVILPWLRHAGTAAFGWEKFSVAMIGKNVVGRDDWLVEPDLPAFHHANPDAYYNLQLAWRRLHSLGCRRVALVLNRLNDSLVEAQQRACFLVMQEALPRKDRLEPLILNREESRNELAVVQSWMRRIRPDGILVYHARLSEAALADSGCRARIANLNLTPSLPCACGIDTQHARISAAAVDIVAAQVYRNERGRPPVAHEVLIKGTWRGEPVGA